MHSVLLLHILSEHVSATCNAKFKCHESNAKINQGQEEYLHFFFQATLTTEGDHVISDGKVTGQGGATSDQHGVDAIQILVAEKCILLPVILYIFWKKSRVELL